MINERAAKHVLLQQGNHTSAENVFLEDFCLGHYQAGAEHDRVANGQGKVGPDHCWARAKCENAIQLERMK